MADAASLLNQRREVDPPLPRRRGEVKRGGRHRKARGLDAKVPMDDVVRHLVVASATDAMDELIREKGAEEGR